MTTAPPAPPAQTAQAPPPPSQQPLFLPGQQLTPSPDRDRPWRVLTVLLGSAVVLLLISGLTLATAASWAAGRGYSEVAATTGLGTPTSLNLTSEVGSVRVLPSEDVDEVTLALVEPGATALPPQQETVRARITHGTDSQGTTAVVSQPQRYSVLPWMNPGHDVLLLVPVGHELSLDLRAEVGNVMVDGEFDTLSVHADVGDLVLGPLTATEKLTATSEVGNIDIELASPAPASVDITAAVGDVDLLLPVDAGGDVAITAELGSVEVALPGSARWEIAAESELGSVDVDRSLTGGTTAVNGTLTVTSELGGITISR